MAERIFFAFLGMIAGVFIGFLVGYSFAQEEEEILIKTPTANIIEEHKEEIPKD